MRTAPIRLLTIVAVASMSAAACGDDPVTPKSDATDATNPSDGDATTTETDGTTTPDSDGTTTPDSDAADTETVGPVCGLRECGTFGDLNCGNCDSKPGTECNDNGRCVVPGKALGGFCGITSTCTEDLGESDFAACLDAQCDTGVCMSNAQGGVYAFAVFRDFVFSNSYCTDSCQIYQDDNNDGVNDPDAQDDCNPPDIVNGPVGNAMRCVNFAPIDENPVGLCVPGTTFAACDGQEDCTVPGESCEFTSALGVLEGRCVANYKSGTWGTAVGPTDDCNKDPEAGEVTFCTSGYCEFYGCSDGCAGDGDCSTVNAGACSGGKCAGKPGKTCTSDVDCSSWECNPLAAEIEYQICAPKKCTDENGCGGGYSCQWGWNGSVTNASTDNDCVQQIAGGEDLGKPCDPDPSDTDVVNGGKECKSGLCNNERCSLVCSSDDQCGTNGFCAYYEFSDRFISCDVDADCGAGNACTKTDGACYDPATQSYLQGRREDGDTFIVSLQFCASLEGSTGSCQSTSDCAANEACELYLKPNYDGATLDADAPVTLAGSCRAATADGELGDECTSPADCASGFCLDITDTFSICSQPCTTSADCGSFNVGEDPVNGYCDSYLYSFAGDLDNFYNFTYVGLCVFDFGSTADCSDDFTCDAATEACFPNAIAGADPTKPGKVENICFQVWATAETVGTKTLGQACDPNAEIAECASGLCTAEVGDDTKGYCSALCKQGGEECGTGDLSCTEVVRNPRAGDYAVNTQKFSFCLKDQGCSTCTSQLDCPGSLVCANLGTTAASDFRCVEGCTAVADCSEATVTTACNDTVDSFGVAAKGCFAKSTGGAPQNFCAAP